LGERFCKNNHFQSLKTYGTREMSDDDAHVNFTIYLIKKSIIEVEKIIVLDKITDQDEIKINGELLGHLYIKKPYSNPPRWSRIFDSYFDTSRFGYVSSSSALLLIYENERYFAVTFGQGRYLMQPDCWEERFGLKVALNSIAEDSIKSLDKKTFDDISKITREQASRKVSAQEFGLDIARG
jgi:uncharacterized protein (TIGR04141 family)